MLRTRRSYWPPSLLVTAALAGCGHDAARSGQPPTLPTDSTGSFLTRASSCDDLLARLQSDAIEKINVRVDANLDDLYEEARRQAAGEPAWGSELISSGASSGASSTLSRSEGDKSSSAVSSSAPASDPSGSSPGASSSALPASAQASTYSETNTQVKGVDEADIVKNDGKHVYVLRGREFFVVNAWPAETIAPAATMVVEGHPLDMFVADGKAIIYSLTNGASLYEDTGTPLSKTSLDAYDSYAKSTVQQVPQDSRNPRVPFFLPVTKITVVTLDKDQSKVISERYVEGKYIASR